jgi:hypothetical protein
VQSILILSDLISGADVLKDVNRVLRNRIQLTQVNIRTAVKSERRNTVRKNTLGLGYSGMAVLSSDEILKEITKECVERSSNRKYVK